MYHKCWSYNIWCLKYKVWQTEIVILGHFLPFQALTTPKIKILNMKITPGDIILHIWTINGNHMKCGSWDVKHNIHNFLPFWTVFCPFTPHYGPKKLPEDIIILHMCTINESHMMYGSWDMESTDRIFCQFGSLFALLPPNNPRNQNFEKMKKRPGDIII